MSLKNDAIAAIQYRAKAGKKLAPLTIVVDTAEARQTGVVGRAAQLCKQVVAYIGAKEELSKRRQKTDSDREPLPNVG